jgi:hypothetical protein
MTQPFSAPSPGSSRIAIFRGPEWLAALVITIGVVWLHFYFLVNAGGFWRDEVNLINLAGRDSLAEMSKDSFPILMPLLLRVWSAVGFGHSETGLRLLGTFIGLGIPAVLWLAAWKIKRSPPLLGLALLALNSALIQFGDSLRAYGVGSLTIMLAAAGAAWFLQKPTWCRAWIFAAATVLTAQSLFQNAIFIAAICFGAWAVCARRKDLGAALKIFPAALISVASLLPYWSRVAAMPESAKALRIGFNPAYVFANFDNAAGFPWEQFARVWEFLALVVVACGLASLFIRKRSEPPDESSLFGKISTMSMAAVATTGFFWFAVSPSTRWWFFPLLAAGIIWLDNRPKPQAQNQPSTASPRPLTQDLALFAGVTLLAAVAGFTLFLRYAALVSEPWYFLPLLALAAICFEFGLPAASRNSRAAIFGFAIMTAVMALPVARGDLSWRMTNVDLIAKKLSTEVAPEDFVVVNPWYCGITFDRYFKGAARWDTLPPLVDHSTHRFDLVSEQLQKPDALQPVFDQMTAALKSGHRVWIVTKPGFAPAYHAAAESSSDWSNRPYAQTRAMGIWSAQCEDFIATHCRKFRQVYRTTDYPVNPAENLQLCVAGGWLDNSQAQTK